MQARYLLIGDVIAHPYDEDMPPERLVVLFARTRRNGGIMVGAANAQGHRSTFFFRPDEVVPLIARTETLAPAERAL